MKIIFFTGFWILFSFLAFSQDRKSVLFKDGDRVDFIGNSITHGGEFHNNIFLYYATRFPAEKVSFFNCGISGDVAGGIISRMDSDILVNHPTFAAVMIGMNDVYRDYYSKTNEANAEIERKKAETIEVYKKNTSQIASMLTKYGCKLIIQLPSIYDQTAKIPADNHFGVNDALGKCAEHLRSITPLYQATVVDYYSIMKDINQREQMKDSTFTIVGKDRVHPQFPGHLVMAYQFLKSTGAPKYVSKMILDAQKRALTESVNCAIKIKSFKKGTVLFECLENALPFPVKKEAFPALSLVPFTEELNQEVLQINNLEQGNYDLYIDKILIDNYSSIQLSKGINLAVNTSTPQYLQSLGVMKLCIEYQKIQSFLRNIAYIENKHLGGYTGNIHDFEAVKEFLKKKLAVTPEGYLKISLEQYLDNKPKQVVYQAQLKEIRDKVYQTNIPVNHTFELLKNSTK